MQILLVAEIGQSRAGEGQTSSQSHEGNWAPTNLPVTSKQWFHTLHSTITCSVNGIFHHHPSASSSSFSINESDFNSIPFLFIFFGSYKSDLILMDNQESPSHSPLPKHASVAAASDLRYDQIQHTEESLQRQLAKGNRIPVKPPPPLKVSGRVLVAAFLLPWEASIDLENGSEWVCVANLFRIDWRDVGDYTPTREFSALLFNTVSWRGYWVWNEINCLDRWDNS